MNQLEHRGSLDLAVANEPPQKPPRRGPHLGSALFGFGVALAIVLGALAVFAISGFPRLEREAATDSGLGSSGAVAPALESEPGEDGRVQIDQYPEEPLEVLAQVDAAEAVFNGHTNTVSALLPLPDGRVASAGNDGVVFIWWPDEPSLGPARYDGHTETVTSLVALSDGRLASGGLEGTVQVWRPGSATAEVTYEGHEANGNPQSITALLTLPDGRVASAGFDRMIHVWDPNDLASPVVVYDGHASAAATASMPPSVVGMAMADDGHIVSVASDGQVLLWSIGPDPQTLESLRIDSVLTSVGSLEQGPVLFGTNGVVVSANDSPLDLVAIHDGIVPDTLARSRSLVTSLASLADGRVASGATNSKVTVWSTDTIDTVDVVYNGHTEWVSAIAELPDGRIVSASGGATPQVHVWAMP